MRCVVCLRTAAVATLKSNKSVRFVKRIAPRVLLECLQDGLPQPTASRSIPIKEIGRESSRRDGCSIFDVERGESPRLLGDDEDRAISQASVCNESIHDAPNPKQLRHLEVQNA